jgi:hypothetical protein
MCGPRFGLFYDPKPERRRDDAGNNCDLIKF